MASQRSLLIAGRSEPVAPRQPRRPFLFPAVALGAVTLFSAAPWPFAHKAHAALHGLCAQRPSHSLFLGGDALPFDARMTGIYGGFLVATAYLAARRRFRSFRMPPPAVLATLGLYVAAMALDGGNALLVDLGLPHPYAPDNRLRLATGLLTGTALAVVLCFLLATTLWRTGRWERAPVKGLGELALVTLLQLPFALVVVSEAGWLYRPVAALLLVAATAVVGALMLVVAVLVRGMDRRYDTLREVQGVAAVGLLLGMAAMGGMAAGRFWLEGITGAPPLP